MDKEKNGLILPDEDRIGMLKTMMRIRNFEQTIKRLKKTNLVDGAIHVYIGEEAIGTGLCMALKEKDYIFSTHRGHGHAIARGFEMKQLVAELMGKATGISHGYGGSMHFFCPEKGLMGGNGIVGGGITLSLGTAYASRLRKDDLITVCFFSDGATNEGWLHEAMNMAALWKLPLIFALENNKFAATTPSFKALSNPDVYKRAEGYGILGIKADGNDADDVYAKSKEVVDYVRGGNGPAFVEYKTYRTEGHCMVVEDLPIYRPADEVKYWAERDPILVMKNRLTEEGILTPERLSEIEKEIAEEMDEAIAFGKESPLPDVEEFNRKIAERYAI